MALSEFAINKAKHRDKPYRIADGDGLNLLLQPNGSKSWQLRYRFNGKENVLSFGKYPIITLGEARQKRNDAKKLIFEGIDPSVKRKTDKIAAKNAARETFGLVADDYLQQMTDNGASEATLAKNTWLLKNLAKPLERRPIREIHAAEILDVLKRIEQSGRRESARRLRGTISSVYKLAIVTLRADENPTMHLHGALLTPQRVGRAAIVDERRFGQLLNDIDDFDGWPTIKAALKFLALTCVRPGEVRGAKREEMDFEKAIWHIPAERMKMRAPHEVPLSKQALSVLEEIWLMSEDHDLVFPSIRSKDRPLSNNAFNSAIRRMGYSKEEVTAHGFRVSASTILNSRAHDADVIEAILAHQDQNSIRRTYNRASYWDQRVELMQLWADLCDECRQM
jgi:integrase